MPRQISRAQHCLTFSKGDFRQAKLVVDGRLLNVDRIVVDHRTIIFFFVEVKARQVRLNSRDQET